MVGDSSFDLSLSVDFVRSDLTAEVLTLGCSFFFFSGFIGIAADDVTSYSQTNILGGAGIFLLFFFDDDRRGIFWVF